MELSSFEFHKQAFEIILSSINGATKQGIKLDTMPPHLSVIEKKPVLCEDGHIGVAVSFNMPEILQDVDPISWSWIARNLMKDSDFSEGFVFWCLVEDDNEGTLIHGLSYQKGGEYNAFLCNTSFNDIRSVEPFEIVPFLYDDYEQEMTIH